MSASPVFRLPLHEPHRVCTQEVEQLRGLLEEGQGTIEAKALHFPTGAQLLNYVEDGPVAAQRGRTVIAAIMTARPRYNLAIPASYGN